jgi:transposase
VEKILKDALVKISVVISGLSGAGGRRFLDALAAGERSPAALAALGDPRLKATRKQLEDALTGRFRGSHAFEISTRLRLIDAISEEIARLDEAIGQQLAVIPRAAPCRTACGLAGGGHAPGRADQEVPLPGLAGRLDEITGTGECNAAVVIAEPGTGPSAFPAPGHAAAWARLAPRTMQSGETARPGRTGKGNRYIRGAPGQAAMTAAKTDTRPGAMYRRIARKRGKQKAIVAVSRIICEIAWILICDPGARYQEPGPGYYHPRSPARQARDKIRDIERLNPGKKVILVDVGPEAGAAA